MCIQLWNSDDWYDEYIEWNSNDLFTKNDSSYRKLYLWTFLSQYYISHVSLSRELTTSKLLWYDYYLYVILYLELNNFRQQAFFCFLWYERSGFSLLSHLLNCFNIQMQFVTFLYLFNTSSNKNYAQTWFLIWFLISSFDHVPR